MDFPELNEDHPTTRYTVKVRIEKEVSFDYNGPIDSDDFEDAIRDEVSMDLEIDDIEYDIVEIEVD